MKLRFQSNILDLDDIDTTYHEVLDDLENFQLYDKKCTQENKLIQLGTNNKSHCLELKEDTLETRTLWRQNSLRVFKSHSQQNYKENVFVIDTTIPIHYYSQNVIDKNKEFKTLMATHINSFKNRFEDVKDLQSIRMFNPKRIQTFLAVNPMENSVKTSKSKNKISNWLMDKTFAQKDLSDVCKLYGSYYNLDEEDLLMNESRDYSYLLYKCREWNKRDFWKYKYAEIKRVAPGHALLGRYILITPWNAAICDRGFSEQNLVVTKRRTSTKTRSLRNLMMIALNGPKWVEENKLLQLMIRAVTRFALDSNYKE